MPVTFSNPLDQIEALYVGYFGRAADPAGLNYWLPRLTSGEMTYAKIAASFSVQPEATARFAYLANPGSNDPGAFIDKVFLALFNRVADTGGKDHWLKQLSSGASNSDLTGAFILDVISGAQGADVAVVMNKVGVASHFTTNLVTGNMPYDAAAAAESLLQVSSTDGTQASVDANEARADAFIQVFSLAPATASVDEGQHDIVTLTTAHVAAGTTVGFTITGIDAARLSVPATGTVTIDGAGKASIDLGVLANNFTDGATKALVTLTNGKASTSVIVVDTSMSITPGSTFALVAQSATVDEGQHDIIALSTTNIVTGSIVSYTITGISADRLVGGVAGGTVTIDANGKASIDLGIIANGAVDGSTTAVISLNNGVASTFVIVNDTSTSPSQVTGTSFDLTTAPDSFAGGAGNDVFKGTFSDGAANSTLTFGDALQGKGGSDSLVVTSAVAGAATTIVQDAFWSGAPPPSIENISITTGAGAITLLTGGFFAAAFAGGVNLTTTTTGGAIAIDMTSYGDDTVIAASSGAGAQTIVTGSGADTVIATSTEGAVTISGVGLTTVSATTTGAGAQTIGDLTGGGGNLVLVEATGNAGAQVIHSTSASDVTIHATTQGGPQTITTGVGSDTIVIGSSAATATINAGADGDRIILGATHSGVNTIVETAGHSTQAAFDVITNFSLAVSDVLSLGTTHVLSTAELGGAFVATNGIAAGATLEAFLAAVTSSTTVGVAAYFDGFTNSTYVAASDGFASGAADTVVQLIGLGNASSVGGTNDAGMIHIV